MPKHEEKTCPRCGRVFECKVNNPLRCDCSEVELSDAALHEIHGCYPDCLCLECLVAISAGQAVTARRTCADARVATAPAPPGARVPGPAPRS